MGSRRYARYLKDNKTKIQMMICLDMVGYYSPKKIQRYPNPQLAQNYPDHGDFVAVVASKSYHKTSRIFFTALQKHNVFPSYLLFASPHFRVAGWSDHGSFWHYDYPGVLVMDTAFYRNRNYHRPSDRPKTLNYQRMAQLTIALAAAIRHLDRQ